MHHLKVDDLSYALHTTGHTVKQVYIVLYWSLKENVHVPNGAAYWGQKSVWYSKGEGQKCFGGFKFVLFIKKVCIFY